jgi:hypothetical protein
MMRWQLGTEGPLSEPLSEPLPVILGLLGAALSAAPTRSLRTSA